MFAKYEKESSMHGLNIDLKFQKQAMENRKRIGLIHQTQQLQKLTSKNQLVFSFVFDSFIQSIVLFPFSTRLMLYEVNELFFTVTNDPIDELQNFADMHKLMCSMSREYRTCVFVEVNVTIFH